jgi:predicted HicB family RNase H-like nuclease
MTMKNILKYKDFTGSVQYNAEDRVFHGKIEFITDLVTFEGTSVDELEKAFAEAVADYPALCQIAGKQPERAFVGSFNIRMKPDLHRKAAITSLERGISLNQLVTETVTRYVNR